jgi:hypothetical protein
MNALKQGGRVAAGVLSAAALVRLGWPAFGALAFLVVLGCGLACWVLSSDDRAARLTSILGAWRNGIRSPEPDAPAISAPGAHGRRRASR